MSHIYNISVKPYHVIFHSHSSFPHPFLNYSSLPPFFPVYLLINNTATYFISQSFKIPHYASADREVKSDLSLLRFIPSRLHSCPIRHFCFLCVIPKCSSIPSYSGSPLIHGSFLIFCQLRELFSSTAE